MSAEEKPRRETIEEAWDEAYNFCTSCLTERATEVPLFLPQRFSRTG